MCFPSYLQRLCTELEGCVLIVEKVAYRVCRIRNGCSLRLWPTGMIIYLNGPQQTTTNKITLTSNPDP